MDLYARKIIAWTLADTMEVSTVVETINKAKACRNTDLPLIIHSDRGSQYVSNAWREVTEKMQRSYSHSGYPYDNACIESFHATLKKEEVYQTTYVTFEQARIALFQYIEGWYNRKRMHGAINYLTPEECEQLARQVA